MGEEEDQDLAPLLRDSGGCPSDLRSRPPPGLVPPPARPTAGLPAERWPPLPPLFPASSSAVPGEFLPALSRSLVRRRAGTEVQQVSSQQQFSVQLQQETGVELITKRDNHIASLFRKHEAKKIAPSSSPLVVDDEQTENDEILVTVQSDIESETKSEDATPHPQSPQQPYARSYDAHFLPYDPGERIPISRYNVNDQDDVRRTYIGKGPCQTFAQDFPTRKIQG